MVVSLTLMRDIYKNQIFHDCIKAFSWYGDDSQYSCSCWLVVIASVSTCAHACKLLG